MSNIDLILMGVKNLWRRKLRTFLTVLGVIIGASSIIVMLSIGFGLNIFFENEIARMGNLTTINVHKSWGGGGMGGMGGMSAMGNGPSKKDEKLDDKAIEKFKNLDNVEAVSPTVETYGSFINGRYVASASIKGIDPKTMESFGFEVEEGRLLNGNDKNAVVFGSGIKDFFNDPKAKIWREIEVDLMKDRMSLTLNPNYGYEDMNMPGQKTVNYKEYDLKTAGVLVEGNWETMYSVYMPIDYVESMIKDKNKAEDIRGQSSRNKEYDKIDVKVNEAKNVRQVQDIIKEMGFDAFSLNDQLDSIKSQTAVIQAVLGGIGAISLLVAAIGITNTMIMSIYERTKEIGVMKVIGASLQDIRKLFLFESALIGLLGGIFGVMFSYLLSFAINRLGEPFLVNMGASPGIQLSHIPLWLIFASMAFSASIGVLAGFFPARRAMNLSALEAIRTE